MRHKGLAHLFTAIALGTAVLGHGVAQAQSIPNKSSVIGKYSLSLKKYDPEVYRQLWRYDPFFRTAIQNSSEDFNCVRVIEDLGWAHQRTGKAFHGVCQGSKNKEKFYEMTCDDNGQCHTSTPFIVGPKTFKGKSAKAQAQQPDPPR